VILGLVGLFLYRNANSDRSLDRTAPAVSQQRTNSEARSAPKTDAKEGGGLVGAVPLGPDRTVAPAALEIAYVVIGIPTAEVGPLVVNRRETATHYLTLKLRVTNISKEPLAYVGFHAAGARATLRDSSQNHFNFIKFSPSELPKGCIERAVIQPQETISDMLVFENPTTPVGGMGQIYVRFDLDLPLGYSMYRFQIPWSLIQRPPLIAPSLRTVKAPPPVPPQPVPSRPVPSRPVPSRPVRPQPVPAQPKTQAPSNQATTRKQILADYKEKWAQAQRIAKSKSRKTAQEYLRARKQEIISEVAEKFGVTRQDVKGIVPP
jgi:hypothetical protein